MYTIASGLHAWVAVTFVIVVDYFLFISKIETLADSLPAGSRLLPPIGSLVVCDEKLVICSSDLLLILAHTTWQRRHQFLFQCCCCCCIHQESERNWPGWNWMNSQCWRLPWQRTYWFFMYALLFLFSSKVCAQKKKKVRPHSTSLRFFLSTCSSSVTSRCIL